MTIHGIPTTEHGWASEELLAIWERAQEALLKAEGK